jgi:predicted GNAT family N-acyltransferase
LRQATRLAEPNRFATGIEVRRITSVQDFDACLRLRREVFTVEQEIPADLDDDGLDPDCRHYLAFDTAGNPIATARVLVKDKTAKIGRVAVAKTMRGQGVGSVLMLAVHVDLASNNIQKAQLSAQISSVTFYENLGYQPTGSEYIEAEIPHIAMWLDLTSLENKVEPR